MPTDRDELFGRIKGVEREYGAVRLAMDRMLEAVHADASVVAQQLRVRDVNHASAHLEPTYVIRLFAEFEAGLRSYWHATRQADPPSRAYDLVDGIGKKRLLPTDFLNHAHQVREYRNSLLHGGNAMDSSLAIATARQYLCRFLSYLPVRW